MIASPIHAYQSNPYYTAVTPLVSLVMVMSLLYPTSKLVKKLVAEKEFHQYEIMKIMGLNRHSYILAWLSRSLFNYFIMASITCLMLINSFLDKVDFSLLFLVITLFYLSLASLSIVLSTCFYQSKIAAIMTPIVLFLLQLPKFSFVNTPDNVWVIWKLLSCIFSPVTFSFAMDLFLQYQAANLSFTWQNLYDNPLNMYSLLIMLGFNVLSYSFMAWYFYLVKKQQYGISYPYCFCFQKKKKKKF